MKRITLVLCSILVLFVIIGCKKTEKVTLTINDITVNVGETKTIEATFKPEDKKESITYEFTGSNISIAGDKVKGLIGGTETTVQAKTKSGVKTSFKVKVNAQTSTTEPPVMGSLVNGGFETGEVTPWVLSNPNYVASNENPSDVHSGDYSFKLWYDADEDTLSEALDLTIHQEVDNLENGKYAFTVWLYTAISNTTIWAKNTLTGENIAELTITGSTKEYRQYGIEVNVTTGSIIVGATFTGEAESWGFADDFALVKDGSLPDMEYDPVETPNNVIRNNGFETDALGTYWTLNNTTGTLQVTSNAANSYIGNNYLGFWGAKSGEFSVKQSIAGLPNPASGKASFSVYLNGEAATIEEYYIYIKTGGNIYKENVQTTGWDAGYQKFTVSDVTIIDGKAEVGLCFKQTTELEANYWVNIDNFILVMAGFETENPLPNHDSYLRNLKINGVAVSDNSVTLPTTKVTELVTSKDDLKSLITADIPVGATLLSATYDEETKVVTLKVKAEDGHSTDYTITVVEDVLPSSDTTLTEIKISDVAVLDNVVSLPQVKINELIANKADIKSLVSGTLAYGATITEATYDSDTMIVNIKVTAEDNTTTKDYQITVEVELWSKLSIADPSFESSWDINVTGWSATGFKDQWIIGGDDVHSGSQAIKLWDKMSENTATITQMISGLAVGDVVRLSAYIKAGEVTSISLIIGSKEEVLSNYGETYQLFTVTYTLTETDIVEGKVTIGVKFVSDNLSGVWAGVDDFVFEKQVDELSDDTSLTEIKVNDVEVVDGNITLPKATVTELVTNKDNLISYIEGTLASGASITSAIYNEETKTITITVTAEDGTTTKEYTVLVSEEVSEENWEDIELVNPGFEGSYSINDGWTSTGFIDEWIIKEDEKYEGSRSVKLFELISESPAMITQNVSGLNVGNIVKLSVYLKIGTIDKVSLIIGTYAEELTIVGDDFALYTVTYTLTEADIVDDKLTIGIKIETSNITGVWGFVDAFSLQKQVAEEEPAWTSVELTDPSFETSYDVTENWDTTGFNTEWIIKDEGYQDVRAVNIFGVISESPATITQGVSGLVVGDTVKLSVYLKIGEFDKVSLIIGSYEGELTIEGWDYALYSVTYTLTETDIIEGKVTIGIKIETSNLAGVWGNIDNFELSKQE